MIEWKRSVLIFQSVKWAREMKIQWKTLFHKRKKRKIMRKRYELYLLFLLFLLPSENELEFLNSRRRRCKVCHEFLYIGGQDINTLSPNQRKKRKHTCTNITCTNLSRCPTHYLNVSVKIWYLTSQGHPVGKHALLQKKKEEKKKLKEEEKKKKLEEKSKKKGI